MSKIRLLIADDHPLLRTGIVATLAEEPDLLVVGEAATGEEAIALVSSLRPDVTLMDLKMPGIGGTEAIARILASWPGHRIIVLTSHLGQAPAQAALDAGASGYLLKDNLRGGLAQTIRSVHGGARWVDPDVADEVMSGDGGRGGLSIRELQVLRFVAQGKTNRQVADALCVSEEAIKSRVRTLLAKLGAADRAHAVLIGAQRGYLDT